MNEPPTFVKETRDADTQDKRWRWMLVTSEEGAREGHSYFLVHFDCRTLTVRMEGWKRRPADRDE